MNYRAVLTSQIMAGYMTSTRLYLLIQDRVSQNKPIMAYSRDLADMEYLGVSWSILEYFGVSWGILGYLGVSWSIMEYPGLS